MTQVSSQEFFTKIGPLNVHPRPDVRTFKDRWHTSEWKMRDNTWRVIGRSESDSWGLEETRFYLS